MTFFIQVSNITPITAIDLHVKPMEKLLLISDNGLDSLGNT